MQKNRRPRHAEKAMENVVRSPTTAESAIVMQRTAGRIRRRITAGPGYYGAGSFGSGTRDHDDFRGHNGTDTTGNGGVGATPGPHATAGRGRGSRGGRGRGRRGGRGGRGVMKTTEDKGSTSRLNGIQLQNQQAEYTVHAVTLSVTETKQRLRLVVKEPLDGKWPIHYLTRLPASVAIQAAVHDQDAQIDTTEIDALVESIRFNEIELAAFDRALRTQSATHELRAVE